MNELIWTGKTWEEGRTWSLTDRALHYGDGVFETIRFNSAGQAPLWHLHRQRLLQGFIALEFPLDSLDNLDLAWETLPASAKKSAGKLLISRGSAPRGYGYPLDANIVMLWQAFDAPDWAIKRIPEGFLCEFSKVVLSEQPLLAGIKHLNRLDQILARSRFSANCHEVVMCNSAKQVIEGCMSNIFVVNNGKLLTPNITTCGVNGVIRRWLMNERDVEVTDITTPQLFESEAVFFCNSLNGIIPVRELAGHEYSTLSSGWNLALELQNTLESLFC